MSLPTSWLDDMPHYNERVRSLAMALVDDPAFSAPCPTGINQNNVITEIAGQCGRFRNPDLSKPPPKITLRRGKPYYRRGEPNVM